MFHTVLVANRGEIARRIIRTLRALGIRSVAVYSDADAGAPFVQEADVAVRIGPAAASESYLNIDAVIAAAVQTEAQAIHPGYGFLSENVAFAQACAAANIMFIGPSVEALQVMADKITAKAHVAAHGVPVVPGFSAAGLADDDIAARATEVGYPILVKPSAGGGGKGMQVVREPAELADALATARRVALAAFSDDTLLLERLVERPRHIEVQVLGDNAGTIIHLGERECTLQRRHQKVIEEAPSAVIDAETRARIGAAAVDAARSVSYRGAGTVEFLVASDNVSEFFFIEMNTRLQVEHPVTEMVTGIDLVHQQLRVAAGEELGLTQDDITLTGHAIEARVYAETPARGFLPATGQVLHYAEPANARVDSAIDWFSDVSSNYDPMLAKVIAHAPTRAQAIDKLIAALSETVILGVDTNLEFLTGLLDSQEVRTAHMDTGLLDRLGTPTLEPPHPDLVQAAAYQQVSVPVVGNVVEVPMLSTPWGTRNGWRASGASVEPTYTFATDDDERVSAHPAEIAAEFADDADGAIWVHYAGQTRRLRHLGRSAQVELMLASIEEAAHPASPEARAPMPGNVVAVHVATGDQVEIGDRLVTIEAMKMEHPILATVAGVVTVDVALGDHVARDQRVAHLTPKEDNV